MNEHRRIEKKLEGNDRVLIDVVFRNLPRETEENQDNPQPGQAVSQPKFKRIFSRIKAYIVTNVLNWSMLK
jgi:hypothetical protein